MVWGFIAFCGLGVMFFFCSGIGWCGLGYCCQLELWRYVLVSLVRLPVRVISWIVSKIGKWLRSGSEWVHRTKVSCDGKMMKWRGERKAKPTDEEKTIVTLGKHDKTASSIGSGKSLVPRSSVFTRMRSFFVLPFHHLLFLRRKHANEPEKGTQKDAGKDIETGIEEDITSSSASTVTSQGKTNTSDEYPTITSEKKESTSLEKSVPTLQPLDRKSTRLNSSHWE